MKTQHAPTPELFVEHLKAVGDIPPEWSVESEGRCYARCANEDDAQMIVRAVNNLHHLERIIEL